MRCLFSAGVNLSNFSHGSDQRWNGVVGCDHQFANTLMDSASGTEPHIVQILLTSHCRQIEHSVLCFLHCTVPASPSYPASRKTRTHTHTPFMQAVQTVQTDCCTQGTKFRFTRFTASFRSKAFKICWDPTASGQLLWERLEFYFAVILNAFFIFSST